MFTRLAAGFKMTSLAAYVYGVHQAVVDEIGRETGYDPAHWQSRKRQARAGDGQLCSWPI